MTSRCQGLFPSHPFFKGKALGTRMVYSVYSGLTMYADDHQIYEIGKEMCNLLQGNLQKYQMMTIRRKRARNEQTIITVKAEIINESENLQLLSVTIDRRLKFNEHINSVCMKASRRISVLMRRLRNLIPTVAKLQLYKSAILPHFTYCRLVWHFCRSSDTRSLERLQERGLRAVFRDTHLNYLQQLFHKANLANLCNRRLQDICVLMYKVKRNLLLRPICNLFQPRNHTYQLRKTDLALPRVTLLLMGNIR